MSNSKKIYMYKIHENLKKCGNGDNTEKYTVKNSLKTVLDKINVYERSEGP